MKTLSKAEIIQKAYDMYPPGTMFYPAHIKKTDSIFCTVARREVFILDSDGDIIISDGNYEKNGHNYSEVLYYKGIWAEVISVPDNILDDISKELEILESKYIQK